MDPQPEAPKSKRHKCSACYQQFKKKEHLDEHIELLDHSFHDPKCGVCKKHCKTLESVREHVKGPLPKPNCAKVFAINGCDLCLNIFNNSDDLIVHKNLCRLAPALLPDLVTMPIADEYAQSEMETSSLTEESNNFQDSQVVAMDCEMVGGGSDGTLDLCARVCLIDENENVIFHSFVKPLIPVTNYRHEKTGITEDHLSLAHPLLQVKSKVEEILYKGESYTRASLKGGKARILVGHGLEHDLKCLQMNYPEPLIRDTANYRPLLKTNFISHSLKYLTKTYLGYDIQVDKHNPYEDSVAALRLYKRMRSQLHQNEGSPLPNDINDIANANKTKFCYFSRRKEPEKRFRCWCLDAKQELDSLIFDPPETPSTLRQLE